MSILNFLFTVFIPVACGKLTF